MGSKMLSEFPVFVIALEILDRVFIHCRRTLPSLTARKELGRRGGVDLIFKDTVIT